MPKQHLTLTVDSELVEKARSFGLNISELTQRALKVQTSSPKEADPATLYDAYRALFTSIVPLLQKFRTSVKVGYFKDFDTKTGMVAGEAEINLSYDGSFWIWAYEEVQEEFTDITKIPLYHLDTPMDIYNNLLDALKDATKRDENLLRTVAVVKRLVDATTFAMQSPEKSKDKRRSKHRRSK
jgi:hypothetical protein